MQRKRVATPPELWSSTWARDVSSCDRRTGRRKGNCNMAFQLMIVDDSAAMRAFIVRVIWLSGLEVGQCVQASNGREALELMRENWIDIVLTDINMPVMNGEELVRCMEQDEMLRNIPVLVISTDGSAHRVQQMMALGAKGFVKKPFSPELLRSNMEELLGVGHD